MAESNEQTVIGADSFFKGELSFQSTAKINGKFEGKISGKGELLVTSTASCKADVEASAVHVDGKVEGNLQATDTVKLNSKGTVQGDITATKMVVSEGASLRGMCNIGPNALKGGQAAPQGDKPQGGQPQQGKK